jgi:hypothetical protein
MSQTRSTKPKGLFSLSGLLCLLLAFMVFAWGTDYKLSLYSAKRESSPAKVCTRGSDTAKSALDDAADGRDVAQARLSIVVFSALLQGIEDCSIDWRRDEAVGDLSPLSRAPILHLRPPPGERRPLT